MLIPEHKIDDVLERVDLIALVGRFVELKKSGRSYKGRCPFHQEKTASFYVTPELKRFKCFGCQAGGDAIAFLQRYQGKTFVDAVQELAREVGVELSGPEDPAARARQQLKEVTDFAARHFQASLWHPEAGQKAREYLAARGVADDWAKAFGLGWAPLSWGALRDELLRQGMLEWAAQAGLVQQRSKGDGYFDTFRGRLIVPIRSPEGRCIAFGGRLLEGDDGPKYLNSKESKLYNKSETLYGLDQAREAIRSQKTAVLVEGYFDCLMLHQVGVRSAVALCSTALTAGHLSLLQRAEATELVLLLDGDEAGRKAVDRIAGPLLAQGSAARVALLPEGEDPDTFARRTGADGVRDLLAGARPLTEHLFATALPKGRTASFEDKMKALERLRPIAAELPVGLTRSAFFGALASHMGLPAAELEAALRGKTSPVRSIPKRTAEPPTPGPVAGRRPLPERPPDALETTFSACALKEPALLTQDAFRVADELGHPGLRTLLAHLAAGGSPEDALFEASVPVKDALQAVFGQLSGLQEPLAAYFFKVCRTLKLRRIDERRTYIARIAGQVAHASELNDETRRLLQERAELLELRRRVLEETGGNEGTKRTAPLV